MKLYKGEKTMQMVDKDQVEACLDAGWSRTKPEPEVVEPEVDESEVVKEEETTKDFKYGKTAKTVKIKTSKKK